MLDNILVSEWMTTNVKTVTPDTPISTAHKIMKDLKIRRLPVLEGTKLVGIITLGDVREASPSDATSLSIWELNYLWAQLTVDKVMTRHILVISPNDLVIDAAKVMLDNKVSGLPVVDEHGRLVGIMTESDVFKMLVANKTKAIEPA
ncbi:MAG: CBS domain-containing protein [Anaerolineae bacterium]